MHVVSKRIFGHVDRNIFSCLWQWARRRHPNKPSRWVKRKYFERRVDRNWAFFAETCDDEGRPTRYFSAAQEKLAASLGSPEPLYFAT